MENLTISQFLLEYKDTFRENFLKILGFFDLSDDKKKILERKLDFIFSALEHIEDEKTLQQLKKVLYELHSLHIPVKQLLERVFFQLVEDFIKFLKEKDNPSIKDLKLLVDKIYKFLTVNDEALYQYTTSLQELEEDKETSKEKEEVISYLRRLNPVTVTILTFFREFPIYCKADVIKIAGHFIKVSKCPYKVFTPDTYVYIKLSDTQSILGKIVNVDDHSLLISPLKFVKTPQIKSVRVFPDTEIDVKIELLNGGNIYGILIYISIGEVGVLVNDLKGLKEGDKVKVHFALPTGEVSTTAKVGKITPLKSGYKVELLLDLDKRLDQIISRYVLKRQREILKEIKL